MFSAQNLEAQYAFAFTLNPFYLRRDFNGGSKPDFAILVKKQSRKIGIAICHGGKKEVFFLLAHGQLSATAVTVSLGWILGRFMRSRVPKPSPSALFY